ncbi:F-box/kelch-repeat protein At3g06240-like [Vicia villosa]|uniref:F-box/kelch-repeat protein At3g06240-like n=1 Tax=Vicia villosa TaxID=3911 RepID=UPI00273CCB31|nr:F-box/kelch-repeat protein At3g06240-like [Vicia villosa]
MEKSVTPRSKRVSNHIPDDVSLSILSKLSLKSLQRFECACKQWSILFENPYFMNTYRNHIIHTNHSHYDYYDDDESLILQHAILIDPVVTPGPTHWSTLYFVSGETFENTFKLNFSLPFQVLGPDINIVGSTSINGTLCLSNLLDDERNVVLWNPITDEFNVIPPSHVESSPYRTFIAIVHGFGYDHLNDDYKVIRYVEFNSLSFCEIYCRDLSEDDPSLDVYEEPVWEIYSLKNHSWKKLDVDMSMVLRPKTGKDLIRFYLDGMCHWWDKIEKDNDGSYFVSFDVSNEVCVTTHMPLEIGDTFDLRSVKRHLVMLNKSIGLISYSEETNTLHVSVLGEIGVKESWTKLFIIGSLPYVDYPVEAGRNGDIFFVKKDGELACFNLDTRTVKELGVEGIMSQMVIYKKKSLLSIRGINK